MLHKTTITAILLTGAQLTTLDCDDLFDGGKGKQISKHSLESPQHKPGRIAIYLSHFFCNCSTTGNACKTGLMYSNAKGDDFQHILNNMEWLLLQLFFGVP